MALTDSQQNALEDACAQASGTKKDRTVYEADGVIIIVKKGGGVRIELHDDADRERLDWTTACESKAVGGFIICASPFFSSSHRIDFLPEAEESES